MENLSILLPQVKLDIASEGLTLDTLEKTVFEAAQEAGRAAMTKFLEDYDRRLMNERDKRQLRHVGRRSKKLLTRLGPVHYTRSRYVDSGNRSHCLLDERLKLDPNQRLTLQRSRMEILLANHSSYRASQEDIRLLTGFKRSHEAARQSVLAEGRRLLDHQTRELEKIRALDLTDVPTPPEAAYIEADSTFLRLQRSKKRKSNRNIRKRLKQSLEVKLGIGYTGRTPRYARGARLAQNLSGKFSYVGIGSGFMERLSLLSEKNLSLYKARHVIVGGDGARWIKDGIREHFPGSIYILCRFHLNRAIKQSFSHLKPAQKILLKLLREDRIAEALGFIRKSASDSKDPKAKKKLRDLHAYIHNNRRGINSLRRIQDPEARKLLKNTGAIEPNIDKFISHRFKKKGMSWSRRGALALLKVRETISNGQWDDWWSVQRNQKLTPIKPMNPELSSTQMNKLSDSQVPRITESSLPLLQTCGHEDDDLRRKMKELIRIDYKLGEPRKMRPGRGGESPG